MSVTKVRKGAERCGGLRYVVVTVSLLDFQPEVAWLQTALLSPRRAVLRALNKMADEIRAAAAMLEQMLATDPPDETKVDLIKDAEHRCDIADARHDSAAAPHVRHAVRSRGPVRAGDVARQRDGRDRPRRRAGPPLQDSRWSGRARANWRTPCPARPTGCTRALDALAQKKPVHPHAVEINRLENEADRAYQDADPHAVRHRDRSDPDHQVEGTVRRARADHGRVRGRRERHRRRRRQARIAARDACRLHDRRHHRRRAGFRLHQRVPRRRQLDRDRRLDARAVAAAGGRLGRLLQLRRASCVRHRRRQDRRLRAWSICRS